MVNLKVKLYLNERTNSMLKSFLLKRSSRTGCSLFQLRKFRWISISYFSMSITSKYRHESTRSILLWTYELPILLQCSVRFLIKKRSNSLIDIDLYREFSQTQRGGFADPRMFDQQRYSKPSGYSSSTKKLLAIILPIASLVVLAGVGVLLYLFYKKFRSEQNRARKLSGAIRLEDTYSSKSIKINFPLSNFFSF